MEMAGGRIRPIEPRDGNGELCPQPATPGLHPAWRALIRLCRDMGHGELERIKIQDGLPVSAEVVRKKVRWF